MGIMFGIAVGLLLGAGVVDLITTQRGNFRSTV